MDKYTTKIVTKTLEVIGHLILCWINMKSNEKDRNNEDQNNHNNNGYGY